ncbi:M23 family metallopeptidase [Arenibacter sp. 6A1]|uniref:M23 family metallopeptidase n=1 Tax=Arenibacter sp. 6A1 TaxID=2720391 RepID=UPI001446819B|nr:M23 family metallopeptidase [Arenibacter sp. 6A1]NKI28200.1 M23 family metallopeptidase [Arenibacter sp. 6A1]
MKGILVVFFLLVFGVSHGQNSSEKELKNMVHIFLHKAQSSKDVETLVALLGKNFNNFTREFSYIPTINPLNPQRLKGFSSRFGRRFHPLDGKTKPHIGIDISARAGTPVHAAASGTIERTDTSDKGYGNQVVITHDFGFRTRYAHMFLFIVKQGQTVKKGEIIGFVGSSGKSTGNHIHYELWKNGQRIDPYPFCLLDLKTN